MSTLLYINPATKSVYGDAQGGAFNFPDLSAGETVSFGFRFLQPDSAGTLAPDYPAVKSIKASIGLIDQRPASGCTRLKIGPDAPSDANTTAMLNWNASGLAIQNAINALAAIVASCGEAKVKEVPGGYTIVFASATTAVSIQAIDNTLQPLSFVQVLASHVGSTWVHEVRFTQAPLAATAAFSLVNPPPPAVTEVRAGGTSEDGTYKWTEVQKLTVPPAFVGTYYLTFNNGKTAELDSSDDVTTIQTELNTLFSPLGGSCNVTNPTDGVAVIEFVGSFIGDPQALLGVVVDSAPPGDPTVNISLDTAAVYAALRSGLSTTAVLEVTAWISAPGLPSEDPGLPVLLFRAPVNITRNVSEPGQETAQNADWLLPPSPIAYVPFGNNNVISGQQFYVTTIGDGSHTVIAISHNLDTESIANIIVRENVDNGRVLVLGTDYTAKVTNANVVTLTFPTAPTAAQYALVLTTAGPVAAFIAGLTVTMAQVTGLQGQLNSMNATLTALAALLPQTGPGASSTSGASWSVQLPLLQSCLFFKGDVSKLFATTGVDPTQLPATKPPFMLPAVHASSTTNLPDTLPDPSAHAGTVYLNAGDAAVLLPGGGGIRSANVQPSAFAACDGRLIYPARKDGTTKSYFASAFEQELFRLAINDRMFPVGTTFDVEFGLILQLINADCAAQWLLRIYFGSFETDTTPSTTAPNLKDILWADTPALEQAIVLTPLPEQHSFGIRVQRNAPTDSNTSGLTCDRKLYSVWIGSNAAAPVSANFAVRAVLQCFDTEDNDPTARGWVTCQLIGSSSTDSGGNATTSPAQATITA